MTEKWFYKGGKCVGYTRLALVPAWMAEVVASADCVIAGRGMPSADEDTGEEVILPPCPTDYRTRIQFAVYPTWEAALADGHDGAEHGTWQQSPGDCECVEGWIALYRE